MKSRGTAHSRNGDVDVAIVGAGASGLYAAWRLARETRLRVQLFELDAMRVGGRMYTTIPENMPTMRAELGAMRFSPTQELLAGLIQELGLATMPFSGNELLGVYLRARRLPGEACAARTYAHVPSSAPLPYNLRDDEKGKSAPELLVNAMFQAVPGAAADIPPRQLFDLLSKAEVPAEGGRPLHESGFWNLLMRSLSDEAYQFVFDSFGIESALSNWNSMAALFTFKLLLPALQGGDKQFRTLADGFSQLAHELKRGFEDEGGEVLLGHRLLACARSYRGDGPGVELTFQNEATGERSVLHARQAILAMPARALELLDSNSVLFESEALRRGQATVSREAAFKLYLGYDSIWWKQWTDKLQGHVVTTLPLRQVFYHCAEEPSSRAGAYEAPGLVLASYSDFNSYRFWAPLLRNLHRHGNEAPPCARSGTGADANAGAATEQRSDTLRAMPNQLSELEELIDTVQRMLAELHGVEEVPRPYTSSHSDWTKDPYGAAWHAWAPGVHLDKLIPAIRKPVDGVPLYICGEAFSGFQGWVEGALWSAEHVLEDYFDLDRPSWLSKDYFIGP